MKKLRVLVNVETSRTYGRNIIRGISRYLAENDHWLVHIEDRGLQETQHWIEKWQGDGIITRTSSYETAQIIADKKIPIVELLGDGLGIISEVPTDEKRLAEMAVEHFLECQLRHFAFFAIGNAWWSNLRHKFFRETLLKHGFDLHVFPGFQDRIGGIYPEWDTHYDQLLPQWLADLPKPIGVWATSDFAATRILDICHEIGIHVPEEIALLGTTNDTLLCNLLTPPLSSIDTNSIKVGYTAAHLLDLKMSNASDIPETPILIPPNGVVHRQSTDIMAVSDPDIADALQYIRNHACLGISVVEVAHHVGISLSTLERRFQQILKRTPEKEITRIRMQRGKKLLIESDLSVRNIATKLGFATVEYFIQVFRKETGMTPKQYRTNCKI